MKAVDWTGIFRKYKGKWVTLKEDGVTVISSGKTAREALEKARKKGFRNASLLGVPKRIVPTF